jgi:hypothetical protein
LEKTNSKILIAMLACCLSHCPLIAQNDTVTSPKKAAVKAPVEVIGLNAGIWVFDCALVSLYGFLKIEQE